MPKIEEYLDKKIAAGKNNNCTLENAGVRREWYVFLPPKTRLSANKVITILTLMIGAT